MQINWVYDPNTKISKAEITSDLYYTTDDGGQTIKKFVNNELVHTFHKYGPENKFKTECLTGIHLDSDQYTDPWPDEVLWLSETYPDIVGKLLRNWEKGYLNKNGEIEDVGVHRGMGVVSEDLPISVNRICQPASIQEAWDYEIIAESDVDVAPDCNGRGVEWIRHKITGQIYRRGQGHPLYPCCAFPEMHGPWPVDEDDIAKYNGKPII